jgi:hypothetical protein
LRDYSNSMRQFILIAVLLAGCSSEMHGKWPSLAARPGEIAGDVSPTGPCAGCGQDVAAITPPPAPVAMPLPADVDTRLAEVTKVIADIEAKAPAQARTARAAITAARASSDRQGDAEVERSRFEALFMPLSIEERRLDVLTDDVTGRDGADAVLARIAALRARTAALQALRLSLPS